MAAIFLLDGADGVAFARDVNDVLGKAVAAHPDRFAGFAHLPMRTPGAAADELERTVRDYGFCGALINGTTEGRFLDDPHFDPILARAERLDVPIYLHPNLPPQSVRDAYYSGLPGFTGFSVWKGPPGAGTRKRPFTCCVSWSPARSIGIPSSS